MQLTPLEFSILWYLCQRQGVVIPPEELFEAVWGEKYLKNNNTVMAHIGRLREKLDEPARNPRFMKTVWGERPKFCVTAQSSANRVEI